ncbi:MAG: hypothetical protein ACOH5I_13385 [Oligoflexus sp.]
MIQRPKLWLGLGMTLLIAFGLVAWLVDRSTEKGESADQESQRSFSSAEQFVPAWECQTATQFSHQVNLRSDTILSTQEAPNSAQEWFFTIWGQVEESCLTELSPFHGEKRWLVHYRWLADGLEQNIQNADLQFQADVYQSLRDGVYIERTATDILNVSVTENAHEATYELWRSFLLGQIHCQEQALHECHESWLNDTYTASYRPLEELHSWQKQATVKRSYRHLNHAQLLKAKIIATEHRVAEIDMSLQSEQETAWAKTKDLTRLQTSLTGSKLISAAEIRAMKQAMKQTRPVHHAVHANQSQKDDLENIYRQELAAVSFDDLWRNLDDVQERTNRYLQIKAWIYLHRDQLEKLGPELRRRSADDRLLRLWLKGLSQTGGLPGQELLVKTVIDRSQEKSLAKYTLAALAFAEEPADEMDLVLQQLINDDRVGVDLHVNILLALGTWAGRLSGERAERLSRFLLDRWPQISSQEEKLALIQAIGNSGFSGAKELLLQIAANEQAPRLVIEAVFALRFVEGSFAQLLSFLNREPHRQGAIRALRFTSFEPSEVTALFATTQSLSDPVVRYQIISSIVQNPASSHFISPDLWQSYLDTEFDEEVRKIIENHLNNRRHSGS